MSCRFVPVTVKIQYINVIISPAETDYVIKFDL